MANTPNKVLTGRRKTAVARIVLRNGTGIVKINGKAVEEYFPTEILRYKLQQPFKVLQLDPGQFDLTINVSGGGITGQAEAVRLAIARSLAQENAEYRKPLRAEGLLTRDPRMVERKKYGRRKARRRFQFSKR